MVMALLAPLGRLVNAIPGPVVGGTALIVFCIIAVMGIDVLRKVDLREHGNLFTLAAALALGLLPILVPGRALMHEIAKRARDAVGRAPIQRIHPVTSDHRATTTREKRRP
jgi:xanthine/uracil permease